VRVTGSGLLVVPTTVPGKVTALGLMVEVTPVPERAAECGLPAALSVRLSVAERPPAAPGLNVRLNVVEPFGCTVMGVVTGVNAKSPALLPEIATLLMLRSAVPGLVTVTASAALLLPST